MPSGIPDSPGSAGGASGSVDFGGATGLREELRQATEGPSGQETPSAPQAGGAPPAQASPPAPGAPDAQPQPGHDQAPQLQQGVFEPQRVGGGQLPPWRTQLQMWAQHPRAGSALRYFASLANKDGMLGGGPNPT